MIRNLVFSGQRRFRISRHLLFWVIYCIYFFVQSITPFTDQSFQEWNTYRDALVSTYCFVPACILSVYAGLFFVWPYLLKKNRYLLALGAITGMFAADIFLNFFMSTLFYSQASYVLGDPGNARIMSLGYLNSIWAITLMGVAMGIRICKDCYLQQRENLQIARRKTRTELDLQKSRLQPAYLYSSLSSIHRGIVRGDDHADEMILRLSDVLSYSLYDSAEETVDLQLEVEAVNEFILLEQLKHRGRIRIKVDCTLENEGHRLPPMLILSFLQQVATVCGGYNGSLWGIAIKISDPSEKLNIRICISGNHSNAFDGSVIAEYCNAVHARLMSTYDPADFFFQCRDSGEEMVMTITLSTTNVNAYAIA